jgi:hypothetical protein
LSEEEEESGNQELHDGLRVLSTWPLTITCKPLEPTLVEIV